jgi:hypothetical protein
MMHYAVNIELVQEGIAVLNKSVSKFLIREIDQAKAGILDSPYLRNTGSENNNFIKLSDSLHELVDPRSFYHIYVVILALYFYWYGKVGLMENLGYNISIPILDGCDGTCCPYLEAAVHQSLVQVQN